MSEEINVKTFVINDVKEIGEIAEDLRYGNNKGLKIYGTEQIICLCRRILEYFEYLEVKESVEDVN